MFYSPLWKYARMSKSKRSRLQWCWDIIVLRLEKHSTTLRNYKNLCHVHFSQLHLFIITSSSDNFINVHFVKFYSYYYYYLYQFIYHLHKAVGKSTIQTESLYPWLFLYLRLHTQPLISFYFNLQKNIFQVTRTTVTSHFLLGCNFNQKYIFFRKETKQI